MTKFILYACPSGTLAKQISAYFEQAAATIGPNPAQDYMPHISLTGFFVDDATAATTYVSVLETLLIEFEPTKPESVLNISNLRLDERFHGLELDAPWLGSLTAAFAERAESPTRTESIRCKEWLHLSFAYQFLPEQHEPLVALARELIDVQSPVEWMLRLYQRHEEQIWTCHREWGL